MEDKKIDVVIQKITAHSPYLDQVIELGNKNSETLGLLPYNAFIETAEIGNIIIAIFEDICVGYLLYRIVKTKNKVSITHLCVDSNYQKLGIGRKLVEYLIDISKEWNGIGLYCRRDYASNNFWEHMGFRFHGEKTGRGKQKKPLTYFWYEHKKPSLLEYSDELLILSKPYQAVIDMNIFIALFNDPNHHLKANWLLEYLVLCVTPEIRNEINRDDDKTRRMGMLRYISHFPELNVNKNSVDQICNILKQLYPPPLSLQDQSDLIQISYAIGGDANFFITQDKELVKNLKDFVSSKFGLSIVHIDDLIIYFDKLINEAEYQTNRLAGSLLHISRVKSGQGDYLANIFHRISNERVSSFREKLRTYLSDPHMYETYTITNQEQTPIAIIVLSSNANEAVTEVPLIRVAKNSLSPALESHLIFWSISQAVKKEHYLIRITDNDLSDELVMALQENSFVNLHDSWEKINLNGVHTVSNIREILQKLQEKYLSLIPIINHITKELDLTLQNQENFNLLRIEKLLWPLKIFSPFIETFIVPIQPMWAVDLFDYELGKQTLFGSDPIKILRMENVYYRSSHTMLPRANSRILWYVSRGATKYSGVMSIRACSYVEEVDVGTPQELFKQFKRLGVYSWKNVIKSAGNIPENKILSFRFSRTEIFDYPITLSEYKYFSGKNSAPQSPQKIDTDLFFRIYKSGKKV